MVLVAKLGVVPQRQHVQLGTVSRCRFEVLVVRLRLRPAVYNDNIRQTAVYCLP